MLVRTRLFVLWLPILLGCGGSFNSWGHEAAAGALDGLTSPDAGAALATVGAEVAKAATSAARDEALGPTTSVDIDRLVTGAGASVRAQMDDLVATDLRPRLKQTIRLVIDEALGDATQRELDALRERLVGGPLQQDIDALAPHLAQVVQASVAGAMASVQADVARDKAAADAEAAKWRPIVVGLAVGALALLACLGFAAYVIRRRTRTIAAMARSVAPPRDHELAKGPPA